MDWITDEIAIGNYLEALDAELLGRHGFRSAVSLDGTLTRDHAAKLGLAEVASYRLVDGPGNDPRVLQFCIDDLCRLARSAPPVLVQCHAGRSRSAVVVAGYLIRERGLEPEAAIAFVASVRAINVTPALVDLLDQPI